MASTVGRVRSCRSVDVAARLVALDGTRFRFRDLAAGQAGGWKKTFARAPPHSHALRPKFLSLGSNIRPLGNRAIRQVALGLPGIWGIGGDHPFFGFLQKVDGLSAEILEQEEFPFGHGGQFFDGAAFVSGG
jgi:hypothetical protein